MGVNTFFGKKIAEEYERLQNAQQDSKDKKDPDHQKDLPERLSETLSDKSIVNQKHKGGRPSNEKAGIKSRKQYTLTLIEDDYAIFLKSARSNGMSFAKFMEMAAKEYLKNHPL